MKKWRSVARAVTAAGGALFLDLAGGAEPETGVVKPRYGIEYATFIGGRAWDQLREVIVFPDGSVLVAGQSASNDAPTTPDSVQPKYAGDDPSLGHGGVFGGDAYLARLSPDGAELVAATFFGGSRQERSVYGIGLDRRGNIVITTST